MSVLLTGVIAGQHLAEEERKKRAKKEKEAGEPHGLSWGSPKPKKPEFTWGNPKSKRRTVMYVLGNPPRTPNEAFSTLDNVFGAEEFSASEAQEVLEEVLDLSSSEARNSLRSLIRIESVEEV